ncbi:MAG: HTH domain-containing protein [Baekduia sp.]
MSTKKTTTSPAKQPKVPARKAAEVVLLDAGRPMHYREITRIALERNIVAVRGNPRKKPDPDATMKTIRSFLAGQAQDENSKFVRVDSGIFDLKERQQTATTAAKKRAAAKAKAKN